MKLAVIGAGPAGLALALLAGGCAKSGDISVEGGVGITAVRSAIATSMPPLNFSQNSGLSLKAACPLMPNGPVALLGCAASVWKSQ